MSDDLEKLRALPVRKNEENAAPMARAAFARAFEPWHVQVLGGFARGAVPVALASIVGLYLMWAFTAAIALNN